MTYRQLLVSEWHLIEPDFTSRNVPLPSPKLASVFGAFDDDGLLVSYLVLQFKLHAEPVSSSNPQTLLPLISCAANHLASLGLTDTECFVSIDSPRVGELAMALGFQLTSTMLVKRI